MHRNRSKSGKLGRRALLIGFIDLCSRSQFPPAQKDSCIRLMISERSPFPPFHLLQWNDGVMLLRHKNNNCPPSGLVRPLPRTRSLFGIDVTDRYSCSIETIGVWPRCICQALGLARAPPTTLAGS
nr:hypothetical protein CFP56_41375 [Quercus suber]